MLWRGEADSSPVRDRELLDFDLVSSFRLRQVGAEFLDLGLVPSFRLLKAGVELLDLRFVASFELKVAKLSSSTALMTGFCLRKELAIKMLDLRNPFWNEGIQPAHCSGKQIGFSRFRSFRNRRRG